MPDFISKDDALKIIEASDFFQSRQPKAKRNPGSMFDFNSFKSHFIGESERDAMLRRHFLRLTFNAFVDQRAGAVSEEGYDRVQLNEWLDALFAEEVREEMGRIPRV